MAKAFKCDVCSKYKDGDPEMSLRPMLGIIWFPEKNTEPSTNLEMCLRCCDRFMDWLRNERKQSDEVQQEQIYINFLTIGKTKKCPENLQNLKANVHHVKQASKVAENVRNAAYILQSKVTDPLKPFMAAAPKKPKKNRI